MQHSLSARIPAISMCLLLAGSSSVFAPQLHRAIADEPIKDVEKQEAKDRKARYLKWMRDYAEGTTIRRVKPDEGQQESAELVAHPIFRYSGDIYADDATMWVWTSGSRPVAFQKRLYWLFSG